MNTIKDAFESKDSFLSGNGAPLEMIAKAEQELGLEFSEEYREYLLLYGIAAYDGHELTGLAKSSRLNVVSVTNKARKRYPELTSDFYVIEEIGIEEIIVLQNSKGEIYMCAPNYKLSKIDNSLSEYIAKI